MAHLPKIAIPLVGKKLSLYLVVSEQAISALLVADRAKEKIPVYYVSHALAGDDTNYSLIEKFANRKLRPYFEAYENVLLANQPIKSIL